MKFHTDLKAFQFVVDNIFSTFAVIYRYVLCGISLIFTKIDFIIKLQNKQIFTCKNPLFRKEPVIFHRPKW
jgi:hypothetical protein